MLKIMRKYTAGYDEVTIIYPSGKWKQMTKFMIDIFGSSLSMSLVIAIKRIVNHIKPIKKRE